MRSAQSVVELAERPAGLLSGLGREPVCLGAIGLGGPELRGRGGGGGDESVVRAWFFLDRSRRARRHARFGHGRVTGRECR